LGAHRLEEAMEWVDSALRDEPRYIASFRIKVALCGLLGRGNEGRQWLERLMDLQPGLSVASAVTHALTFFYRAKWQSS
jgi:hypothetical protein